MLTYWRCLQAADRNGKLNAAGQHSSAWSFSKAKPHTPQQGVSGLQYLYADQMRENLGMFSPGPMYSPEPQPSASPVRTRPANHSMGPRGTTHMQHLRKLDMSPGPVYSGSKQDRRGWHLWGHEVCCQYIGTSPAYTLALVQYDKTCAAVCMFQWVAHFVPAHIAHQVQCASVQASAVFGTAAKFQDPELNLASVPFLSDEHALQNMGIHSPGPIFDNRKPPAHIGSPNLRGFGHADRFYSRFQPCRVT